MSLQERPLFAKNPRFRTPEQAALLALLERIEEMEQIQRVEVKVHIEAEREMLRRIEALSAEVRDLRATVAQLEARQ
jgi:hypothetical protein